MAVSVIILKALMNISNKRKLKKYAHIYIYINVCQFPIAVLFYDINCTRLDIYHIMFGKQFDRG